MANQRPFCCRTKIRFFLTLTLVAAAALFLFNIATQILDIPPSRRDFIQREYEDRGEIIRKWRKEKSQPRNKPVIGAVPCKGKKCNKFMGVLGLDKNSEGSASAQHCRHPLFLPQNDSISSYFSKRPPLKCKVPEELQCGYSGGKITVAADWSCLLQAINRPDSKDSVVEYTSPQLLTRSVDVQELKLDKDFYRLSCVPNKHLVGTESQKPLGKLEMMVADGETSEQHFFTHISSYPDGELDLCPSDKCLPYNVLILGVGSLSQASFRRLLPKTYDYFTNTLLSSQFTGYNVVGDGATGALLPLLTGLDESHQVEARINKEHSHYMDRMELLWNAYDRQGYATLYAEDHPSSNTFNERFQGFERTPTAHYMRPFWLAAESHLSQEFCLGEKPKHQYMLDYLVDFFSAYKKDRKFAIAMLKELTQTDLSLAQHLDDDLLKFLMTMSPFLQNTLVILMTDHGLIPDQTATSWQVKVQARMPLMSIYLPQSFFNDHSDLAHALISNEDKLVTPYDIHHTLKDIIDTPRLSFSDPRDKGKFGQSLFRPIPVDRTCESAGVDIHWCACHTRFEIGDGEIDRSKVKEKVLTKLNEMTSSHRDHCAAYTTISLLSIYRVVPNEQIAEYEALKNEKFTAETKLDQNYYQVTFSATSSVSDVSDLYEVTLELKDTVFSQSYSMVSEIVRLNKPKTKSCSVDKDIIRYCSCLTL